MAKYILLQFDDDGQADEFVQGCNDPERSSFHLVGKVVAEFKKPTQFCQHSSKERAGHIGERGKKFGWFVCGLCKKPIEGGNQVIYNMLENDGRPTWERELFLQVLVRHTKKK